MLVFLGAGASKPFGIPTMVEMTKRIKEKFSNYSNLLNEIETKLTESNIVPDLEAMLTVLAALSNPQKAIREHGPFVAYELGYKDLKPDHDCLELVKEIRNYIKEMCIVPEEVLEKKLEIYDIFFNSLISISNQKIRVDDKSWKEIPKPLLAKGRKYLPIDIYTTNYDLCLERYFRRSDIPYVSDFESGLDKSSKIRLHKLHGSVDWYVTNGKVTRLEAPPAQDITFNGRKIQRELLIYPTHLKQSYEYPYLDMFDSLNYNLKRSAICIAIGYSFRDTMINNVFYNAIKSNPLLKIVLLSPEAVKVKENVQFQRNILPIDGHIEDRLSYSALSRVARNGFIQS